MRIFKYQTDKQFVKFFNEDSFIIAPKIPDNSIDMVCTDVPYAETSRGTRNMLKGGKVAGSDCMRTYDRFDTRKDYDDFIMTFLKHAYRLLKPGGAMYVWMGREYAGYFARIAEGITGRLDEFDKLGSGFVCHNMIIWNKTNPGWSKNKAEWLSSYEMCVYLTKDFIKPKTWNWQTEENMKNVLTFSLTFQRETDHPNEKSIECFSRFIIVSSNPGDVIWEPFAGSGSCIRACEVTGRSVIASEINPDYFKQACKRLGKPSEVGNSTDSLMEAFE